MSQRIQTNKLKRRRGFTYLWIFCLAAVIFILIYKEWTEVLYILATVGVTALLVLVAVADIGHAAPPLNSPMRRPRVPELPRRCPPRSPADRRINKSQVFNDPPSASP
ncbi:MAG: hypothetical protein DMF70_00405 [Acidobacteria bacterium]|nr:MAG: hypothetical protein DMF70_00405 [Acidobacteriota bacterium]